MNRSLAKARERTTKRLSRVELPDCFADATVSAAANAYSRETNAAKASRRRLVSKVDRLQAEPRYRSSEDWGISFTLAEFSESNSEDSSLPDYIAELTALAIGESVRFGGGAAAEITIVRVS